MTPVETKKAIAVMQHYADGGKVEVTPRRYAQWESVTMPSWNWVSYRYRIKSHKPEVGKWYDINGFKLKCIAFEYGHWFFINENAFLSSYPKNYNFSNFKEVQP